MLTRRFKTIIRNYEIFVVSLTMTDNEVGNWHVNGRGLVGTLLVSCGVKSQLTRKNYGIGEETGGADS